jgi:hypothetical protein
MKKLFLLLAFLLLLPSLSQAQIVYPLALQVQWDPSPATDQVTSYIVTINSINSTVSASACSATVCSMNFSIPAAGPHTVTVVATNQWGSSLPTNVTFQVVVPGRSNNVKIVKP